MLRPILLLLTVASIPALAQPPEIQERLTAQQSLIRELRAELTRYKPYHPQVSRSNALISVLEEQSRLLQTPRDRWPPADVKKQVEAISFERDILRGQIANYKPSHPDMSRSLAIIDLLERELRSLQP